MVWLHRSFIMFLVLFNIIQSVFCITGNFAAEFSFYYLMKFYFIAVTWFFYIYLRKKTAQCLLMSLASL